MHILSAITVICRRVTFRPLLLSSFLRRHAVVALTCWHSSDHP
jgi:hypothetical protein